MKHQNIEQLHNIAAVHVDKRRLSLTRTQRLERWAELLESDAARQFNALTGTEYQPMIARNAMRAPGSPISAAFEDHILRAAGLSGETYGEAKEFFELTDRDLHPIVCYCHHGASISGAAAARHVRRAVDPAGIMTRLRRALGR